MARLGITFEQVDQACISIVQEGETPTVQRVRDKLGTGSPNTVLKHLKKWEEKQTEKPVDIHLTPAIAQVVAREIELQTKSLREEKDLCIDGLENELVALEDDIQILESDNAGLKIAVKNAEKITIELQTIVNERDIHIETLLKKESELKAEHEQKDRRNTRTETQLENTMSKLDEATKHIAVLESYKDRCIDAEKEAEVCKARLELLEEQKELQAVEYKAMKIEIEFMRNKLTESTERASKSESDVALRTANEIRLCEEIDRLKCSIKTNEPKEKQNVPTK